MHVAVGHLNRDVVRVRLGSGEHLVEHDAQRVEVCAFISAAARDEFRCDIADSADERFRRGFARHSACESEVSEFDLPVGAQKHVVGFEIPVDHPGFVNSFECGEDRVDDADGLAGCETAAELQFLAQSDRLEVLHDQIHDVPIAGLIVYRDEVGVGQPGGVHRLAFEALNKRGVARQVRVHDLDGDLTVKPQVGSAVHHGHAAAGDNGFDAVAAVEDDADQLITDLCHAAPPNCGCSVR